MKRKYVKPTVALCLVAALAIAGTLAYLTDVTDELTNKFTVTEDVEIKLEETNQDFDLIPGTSPTKDPTITILEDSSYVFTKVVETIPTKALTADTEDVADDNTYSTFVKYAINSTCYTVEGGTIYRVVDGQVDSTTATDWYWLIVKVEGADSTTGAVTGSGYYVPATDTTGAEGASTTYTYVYALVDEDGDLLSVSTTDVMEDPDKAGEYIQAEFPILLGDKVTIPEDLSQTELELLLTDAEDDEDATYPVLLSFTGYAIQTSGLESEDVEDVYYAAVNNELPADTTTTP